DEHRRASNELAYLVLALATERAVQRVLGVATANFAHSISPSARPRRPNLWAREPVRFPTITRPPLRVRSMDATHPTASTALPVKSALTTEPSLAIIKNPLMMKFQSYGDFLRAPAGFHKRPLGEVGKRTLRVCWPGAPGA